MRIRSFLLAVLLGVLLGVVALRAEIALRAQVAQIGPDEAIGFDYEVTEFHAVQVTHFEGQWDGGGWVNLGIPEIVSEGAPVGWNTYRVVPPFTSGQHVVLFRACNALGCGATSDPFRLRMGKSH